MSKKGLTSVGVKWMHRRYMNYHKVTTYLVLVFFVPTTHSKSLWYLARNIFVTFPIHSSAANELYHPAQEELVQAHVTLKAALMGSRASSVPRTAQGAEDGRNELWNDTSVLLVLAWKTGNWLPTQLDIPMACQVARTPWRATSAFVTASRSFQGESKRVNLNNTQSWWRFVSYMDAYWSDWSLLMVQVSLNTQLYYARCVFQALWRPMTVSDDVYQMKTHWAFILDSWV